MLWLRYIGIILPAVINYGFLLLNDGQPNWARAGSQCRRARRHACSPRAAW